MSGYAAYCGVAIIGAGLSGALALRLRAWRSLPALLLALLPLAMVGVGGRVAQTVLNAPNFDWAGARLAPLVSLGYGYHLYYPAADGPVLNTIYAPLSYLIYAPMCLVHDPAVGIVVASVIGVLCFFGPVLVLLARSRGSLSVAAAIVFALLAYLLPSLRMSLEGTSHDCPALGFGLAACLAIYFDEAGHWRSLLLSALFAVLAVWTKQVMAPLLITLPLWTVLMHGWRRGTAHVVCLITVGVPISAILAVLIGPSDMFFNILTLPARHPWNGQSPDKLFAVVFYLYRECFALVVFLIVMANLKNSRSHAERDDEEIGWDDWLRGNRWSLFALVALLHVPTALLGRIKVGGSVNNFSLVSYFLLVAAVELVRQRACVPDRIGILSRRLLVGSAVGLVLLAVPQQAYFFRDFTGLEQTREEQIVRFLRHHPGEAYFPWNPLPHLVTEGRLYHFAYGLFDRDLGGFRVKQEHLLRFVPPHCRYVCFPEGRRQHRPPACLEAWLREFPRRVEIPELPGFECYERND
jgi:hypothetical protein